MNHYNENQNEPNKLQTNINDNVKINRSNISKDTHVWKLPDKTKHQKYHIVPNEDPNDLMDKREVTEKQNDNSSSLKALEKSHDFEIPEKIHLNLNAEKVSLKSLQNSKKNKKIVTTTIPTITSPSASSPINKPIKITNIHWKSAKTSNDEKSNRQQHMSKPLNFTIVPINLAKERQTTNEEMQKLPEIKLTSFVEDHHTDTYNSSMLTTKLPLMKGGNKMAKAEFLKDKVNENFQVPNRKASLNSEVNDQPECSTSPESILDNVLSAASSFSVHSSSISNNSVLSESENLKTGNTRTDCSPSTPPLNAIKHVGLNLPSTPCIRLPKYKSNSLLSSSTLTELKSGSSKIEENSSEIQTVPNNLTAPKLLLSITSSDSFETATNCSRSSHRKQKSKNRTNKQTKGEPESNADTNRLIICEICQFPTEIPLGGIRQLPQNFLVLRKIEELRFKISEKMLSSFWCSLCCEETNATYHCLNCTLNLCTLCKEAHERQRSTTGHKIQNILELRKKHKQKSSRNDKMKSALKCVMHPEFEIKFFCIACLQIACTDCLALMHKGHKYETIAKAINHYGKILKDSAEQTRPLCNYAEHSVEKLNEIAKGINRKCDEIKTQVEAFATSYFEAVEAHRNTLLQQVHRARESKVEMILEQQMNLEKRAQDASMALQFTQELTEMNSDVEILSFLKILLRRFEYCQQFKAPIDPKISDSLHFLPKIRAPSTKNQNDIPMFGIITMQTVEPTLCTLQWDGFSQLRLHKKVELTLISRDADGVPLCHGGLEIKVKIKYKEQSIKLLPIDVHDNRDGNKMMKCSCEGRMPGYTDGCGHGHTGHPGRRHWSCCGNVLENSECHVANKLLNPSS
uniref:B box-type domain-containing protein n=1 Tax=Glossina brevipalpis TaxID=37001 RepID=A0A1A9W5E6_9MUSC